MPLVITNLPGGVRKSRVFLYGSRIIRAVRSGYEQQYLETLRLCEDNDLFQSGIVKTNVVNGDLMPGKGYTLYLEHERVPFITYPFEWPPSMVKDAALFHIWLNIELGKKNLVLFDMHPYNLLFCGVRPVYIDFPKIGKFDDLINEHRMRKLIVRHPFNRILKRPSVCLLVVLFFQDFLPTFLRPLFLMAAGKNKEYQKFILGFDDFSRHPVMSARECAAILPLSILSTISTVLILSLALSKRDRAKGQFWRTLQRTVSVLPVRPKKGAPRPSLTINSLEDTIRYANHRTVLDLWNEGAVSLSAARAGCAVISVDSDEISMDNLYLHACRENLVITPLVIQPDRFFEIRKNSNGSPVLHLSPNERLHCDLVVVNSAVLGGLLTENIVSPKHVAKVFDQLAGRCLALLNPSGEQFSPVLMTWMKSELSSFFPLIKNITTADAGNNIFLCSKT